MLGNYANRRPLAKRGRDAGGGSIARRRLAARRLAPRVARRVANNRSARRRVATRRAATSGLVEHGEDRILTVPNALTALRLACLPVFGALLAQRKGEGRMAAACLLGALGITDGLDGYVARRFDQVSSLGKVADPLVDRALVLTATAGALAIGAVPPWLVVVVLAREAVVAGGAAALAVTGAGRLEVSWRGKAGAFGMMVALPLFIMGASSSRWHSQATTLAWGAAACGQLFAWGAAAGYIPKAVGAVSQRRRAWPDSGDVPMKASPTASATAAMPVWSPA